MNFVVVFPLWLLLLLLPVIIVAKLCLTVVRLALWAIGNVLRALPSRGRQDALRSNFI